MQNVFNGLAANAKTQAYLHMGKIFDRPDFKNLAFGELRFRLLRPTQDSATVSRFAIDRIIRMCSNQQVGRAKARRVVARVTNNQTFRDRAMDKAIGFPMNLVILPVCAVDAISIGVATSRPFQASISVGNQFDQFRNKLKACNLISFIVHVRALLGSMCAAQAVFAHRWAISILPSVGPA